MNHSLAPWRMIVDGTDSDPEPIRIVSGEGFDIAELVYINGPEFEDARLLRAAPDLLAAAKAVIADLKHYVSTHGPGPDRRLDALVAAIDRAEGGVNCSDS